MISKSNRSVVFRGLSLDGVLSYPNQIGIYRIVTKPSGLPSDANDYGTLFIFGIGYYVHLYVDVDSNAWIARSNAMEGEANVNKPTTWRKITA